MGGEEVDARSIFELVDRLLNEMFSVKGREREQREESENEVMPLILEFPFLKTFLLQCFPFLLRPLLPRFTSLPYRAAPISK